MCNLINTHTHTHTHSSNLENAARRGQYNGGFPDRILLTQCYYHRGTRLNVSLQPVILPKRFDIVPPD